MWRDGHDGWRICCVVLGSCGRRLDREGRVAFGIRSETRENWSIGYGYWFSNMDGGR